MYSILLFFAALLYSPYFLWQVIVKGKYRKSFWPRLGNSFPLPPENKEVIWVHAVSVGEVKAVAPIIKAIREKKPEAFIYFSTITETGHDEAKKSAPEANEHVYLPFDFLINSIVKKVRPDTVILCETDFWFNFLDSAKKYGAKIFVVNGKLSEKSLNRFKAFPFFTKALFERIDRIIVQNTLYFDRFVELGISPIKVVVGGNIKLDADAAELTADDKDAFLKKLGIKNEPVIVVGSTHDPEERIFLEAFRNIKNKIPSAKLILVPRHPERFDSVAKLISDKGFDLKRFSQNDDKEASVILVDTMGQLKKCYQIATIAAVAGSWTAKVNGHNILEPSFYGKAVVYGPYMSSQPDFLRLMKDYNGGVQVIERDIEKTLLQLLENQKERDKMGERGKQLVSESKGALKRTLEALSLF